MKPNVQSLFIYVFTVLAFYQNGLTQNCQDSILYFNTQSSIDSFFIKNPSCFIIDGSVVISGSDIKNLNGLNGLFSIEKNLEIRDNTDSLFINLEGLNSLQYIRGKFTVANNPHLKNLAGLNSLAETQALNLENNNTIENFRGLENLTHVQALNVINNFALKDFMGLSSLEIAEYGLQISDNSNLLSLNGLDKLQKISSFTLQNNAKLEKLGNFPVLDSVISINIDQCPSLKNLTGLQNVRNIDFLSLSNNKSLLNFEGLDKVSRIGELIVSQNDSIQNFDGLLSIHTISRLIGILDNPILSDIKSLERIKEIDNLNIDHNSSLIDLSGLDSLETVTGQIYLNNNSSLTSIAQLKNIKTIPQLLITNNPVLKNLEGLENLEIVDGNFTILNNNEIQNLGELHKLRTVSNSFIIEANNKLSTLNGINAFEYAFDLQIRANPELQNLMALSHIQSLKILTVQNNAKLTNLAGLDSLTDILLLEILDNAGLKHITNLAKLRTVLYLKLNNNDLLESLNGLQNLDQTKLIQLYLNDSEKLNECNVLPICQFLLSQKNFSAIANNAPKCNSRAAVRNACLTPLALQLISFDVKHNNQSNELRWNTNNEFSVLQYIVERSDNGIDFNEIGLVMANGMKNQFNSYKFLDDIMENSTSYYRLKIIDQDETYEYSKIIAIKNAKDNSTYIYPTQAHDHLYVSNMTTNTYEIKDIMGRIMCSGIIGAQSSIPLNKLKSGVYFIYLDDRNYKFIKE